MRLPSKHTTRRQLTHITGLKYVDQLAPLLEQLRDDACERDKAGNRELRFEDIDQTLVSDRLYVMDRGYAKFALINKIDNTCSLNLADGKASARHF